MGQCLSHVEKAIKENEGQLKAMAESIDKDAIEVCVKEKMLEVATEAKALAAAWTAKIAAGETVEVKVDDIKPVTAEAVEKDAIKLKLDAASTEPERLKTAVYVAGNEKKREAIKPRCVAEIKESLVAKKALPAIIDNAEKQLPALLTKFLEQQVKAMADKAGKGEPLVSEADETKIAEYRKQQAEDKKKAAEASGAAPAKDAAAAPAAAAPAAAAPAAAAPAPAAAGAPAAAPAAAAPAADAAHPAPAAAAPAPAAAAPAPAAAPAHSDVVAPAQVVVQTA